ncbi:protein of unknown function [Shinella sp. WSC3-e]|nr:hypothetical protein SHINE37_42084 [Rhizobiaceae bacterium]CAK7256682.1 protein of unknown function [Shinella sp. WSC3-e]
MAEAAETRCGWLQNPTPANWWLDDSEGTWTLMTQGAGNEPAGFDRIPRHFRRRLCAHQRQLRLCLRLHDGGDRCRGGPDHRHSQRPATADLVMRERYGAAGGRMKTVGDPGRAHLDPEHRTTYFSRIEI